MICIGFLLKTKVGKSNEGLYTHGTVRHGLPSVTPQVRVLCSTAINNHTAIQSFELQEAFVKTELLLLAKVMAVLQCARCDACTRSTMKASRRYKERSVHLSQP